MTNRNHIRADRPSATGKKHGPTPRRNEQRRLRLRPYGQADLLRAVTGRSEVRRLPSFVRDVIRDAIEALDFDDRNDRRQLFWLADSRRTKEELTAHVDLFAARFPDDPRWDAWRRYRQAQNAYLS